MYYAPITSYCVCVCVDSKLCRRPKKLCTQNYNLNYTKDQLHSQFYNLHVHTLGSLRSLLRVARSLDGKFRFSYYVLFSTYSYTDIQRAWHDDCGQICSIHRVDKSTMLMRLTLLVCNENEIGIFRICYVFFYVFTFSFSIIFLLSSLSAVQTENVKAKSTSAARSDYYYVCFCFSFAVLYNISNVYYLFWNWARYAWTISHPAKAGGFISFARSYIRLFVSYYYIDITHYNEYKYY